MNLRSVLKSGFALAVQAGATILAWSAVDEITSGWQDKALGNVVGDFVVLLLGAFAVVVCTQLLLLRPAFFVRWYSMHEDGKPGEALHGPRETIALPADGSWRGIISISYEAPSLFGKLVTLLLRRPAWLLEIRYSPSIGFEVHHEQVRSFEKERIPSGQPGLRLTLNRLSESRESGRLSVTIQPELDLGRQPIDIASRIVRRSGWTWGLGRAVRVESDVVWLDFVAI